MKHWINKNYRTLIITAFLIPIIIVAIVSISHVTKWYGISNPASWAIYLSVGIEIAALSSIAAISANMGNKIYFPFVVVTLIQFIGNIFFSYQYIDMESSTFKAWVELAQPVVGLFGIEQTDIVGHKRFLALFAGGLMPVISLSFLHFLVKFTEEGRKKDEENSVTTQDIEKPLAEPIGEISQDIIKDKEPSEQASNKNVEANADIFDKNEVKYEEKPFEEPEEQTEPEESEEIIDEIIEQPNTTEEKEELIRKWERLGFLEGLNGYKKDNIEQLFEITKIEPEQIEEIEPEQVEEEVKVEQIGETTIVPNTEEQIVAKDSPALPEWEKKNNYLKTFLRNVKNSKRVAGNK